MYINFSNIQGIIDNLNKSVCSLVKAKEKIEYERKKLALNTELEDVIADMKRTSDRIENEIETAKKLKLSLIKISELYANGEERIKDRIEGERKVNKREYSAYQNIIAEGDIRWKIE